MPQAVTTTVYIVPHTHWDREWYATFETFRAQLVQLWDQLLTLTEADPDFRFLMDGQTVVIDDYLEVRPEARGRLERAVRSGQIQVGPWYTLPDEVLVRNGNDHVLPQAALSAAVRAATGRLDGTLIRLARLDDYLARLPANGWPLWRGELRSSARANVLMGTLSVRVPDKQRYFEATRLLERMAEPLAAVTGVDAVKALDQAWTLILQNAAHDTACGSGIDAVAEASRRRSTRVIEIAQHIIDEAVPRLAGAGQVWNPSPFPRQGLVA